MPSVLRSISGITLTYVRIGLVYLVAGPVLLLITASGAVRIDRDAFFVMQLYGFVTMIVFGISYFFVPGIAYGKVASIRAAKVQIVLFNAGAIGFTVALSGAFTGAVARILTIVSLSLILVATLLHAANLWITISRGLKHHDLKVSGEGKTD